MDSLNDLLSPKGGQQVKQGGAGDGSQSEMQGLFYDLLACLAGKDHPSLPQGFQAKPMTGFSAILDAFNESNNLRQAGSSTITEVGSKDWVGNLSSDKIPPSGSCRCGDSSSTDSAQCLHELVKMVSSSTDYSTQRESSPPESQTDVFSEDKVSDSDVLPQSSEPSSREVIPSAVVEQPYEAVLSVSAQPANPFVVPEIVEEAETEPRIDSSSTVFQSTTSEDAFAEVGQIMGELEKDQSLPTGDNYVMRDVNANWEYMNVYETNESVNATFMDAPVELQEELYFATPESDPITEIGPPLNFSQTSLCDSQFPRELHQIEEDLSKYSDQIRELEKILKENLIPSPYQSPTTHDDAHLAPSSQFARGGEYAMESHHHPERLIEEGGVVKTFMDGMMTPSSILEKMYDADSIGSKSPHLPASTYLSTYQSCTSLASTSQQNPQQQIADLMNTIDSFPFLQDVEASVQRTQSRYMDCFNVDEEESDGSNIFALPMSSYSCTDSDNIMKTTLDDSGIAIKEHNKQSMKIAEEKDVTTDGNSEGAYYSANQTTSGEEEFVDCSDNDNDNSIKASQKKLKKRRNHNMRKGSSSSSLASASERLWTSVSASENTSASEASSGAAKQKVRFYDAEKLTE